MGDRPIDTSGDLPKIKIGALVASLLGTVLYGYVEGFIGFLDGIGDGIASAAEEAGNWIAQDLIGGLFGIGPAAMGAATQANAEFLRSLGILGLPVALLEGVVIVYLLMWVGERLLSTAAGAI